MYYIILILLILLLFLLILFFFPGKNEEDLPKELIGNTLFRQEGLSITRWPEIGPEQLSFPAARLLITDKMIVISQKYIFGKKYALREIMLNSNYETDSVFKKPSNVHISKVDFKKAFSVEGSKLILKNPNALNLKYYEINGIEDNNKIIEIVNRSVNQ